MKSKLQLLFILLLIAKTNAQQQVSNFTYENPSTVPGQTDFIAFNDLIFFNATTEELGREIWKSDGTNPNTKLLKDINYGMESSGGINSSSAILDNELYFISTDGGSAGEIWKTDGTDSGTIKVTDFLNQKVSQLTTVGNFIFFLLKKDDKLQVWKSDGSNEGTVLVKEELSIWNEPTFQGKCNDTFIFTFQPYGTNDSRVWRSDGTSVGTFSITDEIDGNGSGPEGTSALTQYIEYNNKLYFVSRSFLYETDGTIEKTKTIANLWNAQSDLVEFADVIEANNKMYFQFFSADTKQLSIWESDGTANNTYKVYANTSDQYFFPSNLSKTKNALIFSTSNQSGGTSLTAMNFADYATTDLFDLSKSNEEPFVFTKYSDAGQIYKINEDEFFISTAEDKNWDRKGWISNIKTNTPNHISSLDNINNAIIYKQLLYYSKDKQLWKYSNSLSTASIIPKLSLTIYPNPSSDFIKFNSSYEIESMIIYDLSGRVVIKIPKYNNNKIDISKLNDGTYTAKIQLNGTSITKKIIKR